VITDAMWRVDLPEWPTFDIDRDELLAVLDEFGQFWPVAVASLADTPDAPDGAA
jgi:hypothetical protein